MNKIRRIVAGLTVLLIVGLVIGTLICGIIKSPYFYGLLFLSFAVPVVLWVFMWFTHLLHGDSKVVSKEEAEELKRLKEVSKTSDLKRK